MSRNNNKKNQNSSSKSGKPAKSRIEVKKPHALVINRDNKYVLGAYFSLGLNNFFKTLVHVFVKAGMDVISKKGNAFFGEEKVGEVLRAFCKSLNGIKLCQSEKQWEPKFRLNANRQVKLQKLLFHYFPILGPVIADEVAYKAKKNKKSRVVDDYTLTLGATLPECLDAIGNIAQGLVDCRNTDVHYDPYETDEKLDKQFMVQDCIVRYLNKALVASRRIDKKRYCIETEKMEFLTGYAKINNLDKYLDIWHFYPKYDEQTKKDENGNILYVVKTDKNGNPLKDKFGNPIYKQKYLHGKPLYDKDHNPVLEEQTILVERNDYFYKIGGNKTRTIGNKEYRSLTGFGTAYFCAIFLTKTQAKQMFADIKLFDASPYPTEFNEIIRDMMSIYRIRLPRGKKLDVSDDKTILALDILNELRKCPKELYDVLTPKGKKHFEDKVERPNEKTQEVVNRVRSKDRFAYYALRFIDESEMFKYIRFQIKLGKLRFKFYEKNCINGEKEIRSLQKEINGYGRLHEIEIKRKEQYKGKLQTPVKSSVKKENEDFYLDLLQFQKDTVDSKPYLTDGRAFYNVFNNRIGLYWTEEKVKDKKTGEERVINRSGDYLPSLEKVGDGKAPIYMPAPMLMLSIYELPAIIFYNYLYTKYVKTEEKKNFKNTEEVIFDKYNGLKRFFQDVAIGYLQPVGGKDNLAAILEKKYSLSLKEIPDKLKNYLSGEKFEAFESQKKVLIKNRLIEKLKEAIRRKYRFAEDRKMIGNKDNKYGKDSYADVRHGSLASFLANSFLEWQPSGKDGKGKLTGMNFSKLQAELALFDRPYKYHSILEMLNSAHLLTGKLAHPFLKEVTGHVVNNIENFYLLYLEEEIKYLRGLFHIDRHVYDENIDYNALELPDNVNLSSLPFIKGKLKWEERSPKYFQELAGRYLEIKSTSKDGKNEEARKLRTSLLLPDGIYKWHIMNILKQKCPTFYTRYLAEGDNNVAFIISAFFEHELGDAPQSFYTSSFTVCGNEILTDYAHVYKLFNILNNEKTKENAYVDKPLSSNQIMVRLNKSYINPKGYKEPCVYADGKMVTINGKYCFQKNILHEIKNLSNKLYQEGMDKARQKAATRGKEKYDKEISRADKRLKEERIAIEEGLPRMIPKVKDNERAIRRYKVQDMIMFLMASTLINDSEALGESNKLERFKLKYVFDDPDFLNQKIDLEFPYTENSETVIIRQQNMAIKNYGEFYRLLSDDRMPSLITKLTMAAGSSKTLKVDYNNLIGELTSYDIKRADIFHSVHLMEQFIVSNHKYSGFLNDPNDQRFYMERDNQKTDVPKRNNFNSLLKLIAEGDDRVLSDDERDLIISIRNAFSHNHYGDEHLDFNKIQGIGGTTLLHKGTDANKKLTTIATLIETRLSQLQQKVDKAMNVKFGNASLS